MPHNFPQRPKFTGNQQPPWHELHRLKRVKPDMKRLLRWFITIVALFSLLLCLGISAIWVRSYRVGDSWLWYDHPDLGVRSNYLRLGHGYLQYVWWDVSMMTGLNRVAGYYRDDPASLDRLAGQRGK